jgi:outer membrane protein OmpA-like peptidoglycan-associated protein
MLKFLTLNLLLLASLGGFAGNDTLRLYFPIDVRHLDVGHQKSLDSLAGSITEENKIKIIGFADFLGTKTYNQKLSADRAENVKKHLLAFNHKLQIIECSGKGDLPRLAEADLITGIPPHRKVEVILERKKKEIHTPTSDKKEKPAKPLSTTTSSNEEIYNNIKEGENLVWENLNFIGGRHYLLPESYPSREKLLKLLQDYPSLKIQIEGHICCERIMDDGLDHDTGENLLSVNRAKHIYHYLTHKGIKAERLSYKGFGGKTPLVEHEITEKDRTSNRRVEIRVMEK